MEPQKINIKSGDFTLKFKGLTGVQAKEKLRVEGHNKLPSSKPRNFFTIALSVVK